MRTKTSIMIIGLDVDKLKITNDTMGHDAGDLLLKNVGEVLKLSTREQVDTVSRWGGDEFGVILLATNPEGAKAWWQRAIIEFKKKDISVNAGITEFDPSMLQGPIDSEKIGEVMTQTEKKVDIALYVAKSESKQFNSYVMVNEQELSEEQKASTLQKVILAKKAPAN